MFPVFSNKLTVHGVVVSPDQAHYANDLASMEMSFKIFDHCEGNVDVNDVKEGLLVVAKVTDSDWARAAVVAIPLAVDRDAFVSIHFIDNGLERNVKVKDLMYLPSECISLPKQEGLFVLDGLEDVHKNKNHDAIVKTLNDMVYNKSLQVSFVDQRKYIVKLVLSGLEGTVNEFILNNFLEKIKMNGPEAPTTIKRPPSCSDAIRGMMLSDLSVKPFPDEEQFSVCATEVITPSLFYCQVLDDSTINTLQKVTDLLNETYSNKSLAPFIPKVNELCVALFNDDGCWYRASVIQYNADMTARVSLLLMFLFIYLLIDMLLCSN